MRRELVWAIIIGISFGLIIAFGVFRINSSINRPKNNFPKATPISENPLSEFKITLNSPVENSVVTDSQIRVTGITKPLTWLTFSGELGDYILQSDDKGSFDQEVKLDSGVNRIKVTAFDSKGSQSIQKVLVVYSSAFEIKTVAVATPNAEASGDAAIRQKVAQKVAEAMTQPKAYLGVVTDITNTTIQIKNMSSQIEQISVGTEGLAVINAKGTTNKTVKLTDIAIGDFIVAMGYVNGNQVLDAQRILITNPLEESAISVSMSKVTKNSTKLLTASDVQKGESVTITPTKSTVIASHQEGKTSIIKITAIKAEDTIISVTDSSESTLFVRSIFDI